MGVVARRAVDAAVAVVVRARVRRRRLRMLDGHRVREVLWRGARRCTGSGRRCGSGGRLRGTVVLPRGECGR